MTDCATEKQLREQSIRREALVKELAACEETIALLEEREKLEERMRQDALRLAELNEPPEVRAARRKKQDDEAREKDRQDWIRRRQEEAARPSYWPLPRPNMSQREQSDWLDDHLL
jgi:hypothetical protein